MKKLTKKLQGLVDIGVADLHKNQPNWDGGVSVCVVGGGGEVTTSQSQICYHIVRNFNIKDQRVMLSGMQQKTTYSKLSKKYIVDFLNYLANVSPYSSAFLVKDGEWCLDNRCTVMDCRQPGNLIVGGMVCARMLWYQPAQVVIFNELVKSGCSPNLAFFLACSSSTTAISSSGKSEYCTKGMAYDGKYRSVSWSSGRAAGHANINPRYFDFRGLHNFINSKPTFLTPPFYKDSKYYGLQVTFLNTGKRGEFSNYDKSNVEAREYAGKHTKDSVLKYIDDKYSYGEGISAGINLAFKSVKRKIYASTNEYDPMGLAIKNMMKVVPLIEEKLKEYDV